MRTLAVLLCSLLPLVDLCEFLEKHPRLPGVIERMDARGQPKLLPPVRGLSNLRFLHLQAGNSRLIGSVGAIEPI